MLPYRDSRITIAILLVFFLIIIGYGYFEARGILFGPNIAIANRAMLVSQPYIEIKGTATHISSLSMNGKDISVTEDGSFSEPFVLAVGYNKIVLDAKDKYGKTTKRSIEIVYEPPVATSSPLSSPTTPPPAQTPSVAPTSTHATSSGARTASSSTP